MEESSSSPLLEMEYYPGCPGCAYDRKKDLQEGIPYKEFLYVWVICLSAALPVSSLFPYLYFMIRDLHVAKRTEDIGFYAGFVGASFMLGRFLTSTVWGIAADRIGRKPVVMVGILSVVIFNTLFGLSTSYLMAIATRFLLGALNGLLGPIKAYAIEICRPEHQALGLSLVSTAWGIGLIIGPALGGYLALPAEKFPDIFSPDSFFGRFPYFLPCLCSSLFAIVVLYDPYEQFHPSKQCCASRSKRSCKWTVHDSNVLIQGSRSCWGWHCVFLGTETPAGFLLSR